MSINELNLPLNNLKNKEMAGMNLNSPSYKIGYHTEFQNASIIYGKRVNFSSFKSYIFLL